MSGGGGVRGDYVRDSTLGLCVNSSPLSWVSTEGGEVEAGKG